MPRTSRRIAAALACHDRRDMTVRCLRSLSVQQDHGASVAVYLFDDGSTDGTAAAVRAEFPDVVILTGDGSAYWNGGMRRALAAARADGFESYLWVNDDVELDPTALATLLETRAALPSAAPSIVAGATRDPLNGNVTYGGVVRPSPLRPMRFETLPAADRPQQAETTHGNVVLVDEEVMDRIGNLDRTFTHAMGDFDYGLRARRAGCQVWVAPGTVGTCAGHGAPQMAGQSLVGDWHRITGVKGLPPEDWRVFVARWGGPLWPLYFASPYVRRGARAVLRRLRRIAAS